MEEESQDNECKPIKEWDKEFIRRKTAEAIDKMNTILTQALLTDRHDINDITNVARLIGKKFEATYQEANFDPVAILLEEYDYAQENRNEQQATEVGVSVDAMAHVFGLSAQYQEAYRKAHPRTQQPTERRGRG